MIEDALRVNDRRTPFASANTKSWAYAAGLATGHDNGERVGTREES